MQSIDKEGFDFFWSQVEEFLESLRFPGSGISPEDIEDIEARIRFAVTPKDFGKEKIKGSDPRTEYWVELRLGQPGDMEPSPCIVRCARTLVPGSVTQHSYEYI